MSIDRETLSLLREMRTTIGQITDAHTRALVESWARAWDEAAREVERAIDVLLDLGGGRWPGRTAINRTRRVLIALDVAETELRRALARAGITLRAGAVEIVRATTAAQANMIAAQMPVEAGDKPGLRARFDRADPDAIAAIVERTTTQIESLTRPLSEAMREAMRQALVRGILVGENPRVAAREMLRLVEGAFNGGLTRAMVIARTEMLDAHRLASAIAQRANSDVVVGWQWISALDRRTCPSCWSKHGTIYPLDDPGPQDHQMGRCSRAPVVKPWAQLGFPGVREPRSAVVDAQARFASLSARSQLAIMGPRRLALLQSGEVSWADLAMRRRTRGWRDSWVPTPVRDLPRRSAAA